MDSTHSGSFVARLWRGVAVLLMLLALLVGNSIYTSRQQHEEQGVVETYSVARVLESHVSGLVGNVRLALHTVETEQERRLSGQGNDEQAGRAYISDIHANLPDVVGIRITDATGQMVFQTEFANSPPPGAEDQPYFATLRDAHSSSIAISGPHHNGPDGPWVIDIAGRLEYPDGTFAGAVIAPVLIESLETMLAAADVGSKGEVSLFGQDLAIIARYPPLPKSTDPGTVPDQLRELVARGDISGTFHSISPADGVERLYSYRKVSGYPLHITVGRATTEYLGHWRRDMSVVAVLAAVLFGVTIAATLMVDRAWRRQRRVSRLLELQAHTDALTGLANRRRFFEIAEAELARSRRYNTPLSLLMLDIDHFKEVNDAHGHHAGDRVLEELGRTCMDVLRTVDVAGRVGGEEFAILLPETTLEGAEEVAERLREAVEKAEVTRNHGVPLRITVSIGVAMLIGNANLDTLMSQADTALYEAKRNGRNCIRVVQHAR